MIPIASLWLPILLSAAAAFVVSAVIHMLLGYHAGDFRKLPQEERVMDALRGFDLDPGDYTMPRPRSAKDMRSPEYMEKMKRGPVAILTVFPSGSPQMGKQLTQWFIYMVVVGILAAYVTSRAVGPGADYLAVFRFAGATSFIAYTAALWQNSIWYGRSWSASFKATIDGLIYALLTAGIFGWLWPA